MSRLPCVVLVPVKPPAIAKSRLAVDDVRRTAYARAFALDTIAAARAVPDVTEVVVVTSDAGLSEIAAELGLPVSPDAGGLNESLVAAARTARERHPDAVVVALTADLPSLSPDDLAGALTALQGAGPWFVPDADGHGTTLYAATYDAFDPHFGPESRRLHLASGAVEVGQGLASLRRDVDRTDHLDAARHLGVGRHTAEVADSA